MLHYGLKFKALPQDLRDYLEDIYGRDSYEFREIFFPEHERYDENEEKLTPKHEQYDKLKKREVKRKVREKYGGIEWKKDGRRVIDDDYDELEPSFERKLHTLKLKDDKEDELSGEEIEMLLESDL